MLIRGSLTALSLLAGAALANAADLLVEMPIEPISYTYLSIEGGYIHFEGEEVQAFHIGPTIPGDIIATLDALRPVYIDLTDGGYGRFDVGHVWSGGLGNGLLSGVAAYVQGWGGDEDISRTATVRGSFTSMRESRRRGQLLLAEAALGSQSWNVH